MTAPTITFLPDAPDRGDGGAQFDFDATAWAAALPVWTAEVNSVSAFCETQADAALAAAVAGTLAALDLTALKGWVIGVNSAGNALEGVELVSAVQATESDAGVAELATQAEAEAGTDDLAMMTALKTRQAAVAFAGEVVFISDQKASGTNGGTFTAGAWRTRALNTESGSITGGGLVSVMAYDAQTADFTVGAVLTGGTSGKTAIIVADADGGASGTLKLVNLSGTFQDNETITDDSGGSATSNIPSGVLNAGEFYLPAGTWMVEGSAPGEEVYRHQSRVYDITGSTSILTGTSERARVSSGSQTRSLFGGVFVSSGKIYRIEHRCATSSSSIGFGLASGFDVEVYTTIKLAKIA